MGIKKEEEGKGEINVQKKDWGGDKERKLLRLKKRKEGISPNETKDLISNATDCLKRGEEGGGKFFLMV